MTKKLLPIGISDYKRLIEGGYYYVDKTLLVKEVILVGGEVALICRPRRFGKTLNLSMLQYFFEKTENDNSHLFTNTAIWQEKEYRDLQGQYPVIFLTFKDVKEATWETAYAKIIALIAQEYKRHQPLIEEHKQSINRYDFEIFNRLAAEKAADVHVGESLKFLTKLLFDITKKYPILLLDEYDGPIHAAYNNGYYKQMVEFMQGFLSAGLKDNKYLGRAVLTGILRTAKESIFSGLNNLNVCTLLHNLFADKFGFTSQEVDLLLKDQEIDFEAAAIKDWYNGYHAGDNTLLYNPWSILECAKNKGKLRLYWVNTSSNDIIKELIISSTETVKTELKSLLTNKPLIKKIDEGFAFNAIKKNPNALWSLLLYSGYVTYSDHKDTQEGEYECLLIIPNKEIRAMYKQLLTSILEQSFTSVSIEQILVALQSGNAQNFTKILQEFVANSMSYYDFSYDEPEKSYHLFVLGLLVIFSDVYDVRSNRESGNGRYDLMLIPKDKSQVGIIIECKKAASDSKKAFEESVDEAFKQVKENNYRHELHAQSVKNIIVYAIAFYGKKLLIKSEKI